MWLIPPSISSPFAQASGCSTSESTLPSPELARSAWWRGKCSPLQFWRRAWRTAGWMQRLSGWAILESSTADQCVGQWIASLAATRASRTAWPANEAAQTTIASSLSRCFESTRKAGLVISSEKTSRGMQKASSTPWSAHWKGWVATLRSDYSARKKWAAATADFGSSSWQTARVSRGGYQQDKGDPNARRLTLEGEAEAWMTPNVQSGGSRTRKNVTKVGRQLLRDDGSKAQLDLNDQARMWRSPSASDAQRGLMPDPAPKAGQHSLNNQAGLWQTPGTDSFRSRGGDRKDEMGLDQQVRAFSSGCLPSPGGMPSQWPTLTTNDAKRGSDSNRPNRRNEGAPLSEASAKWATPAAQLYNETESLGSWEARARGLKRRGINGNGLGMPLPMQARLWPTPATRDYKGTNSSLHVEEAGTGRMHMDQLPNFVEYGFLPSLPALPTSGGPRSSPPHLDFYLRLRATTDSRLRSEMRSLLRMAIRARGKTWRERRGWTRRTNEPFVRPSFRRQLNPIFAEWLMAAPGPGWTDFAPLETVFFRLPQPTLGSASQPLLKAFDPKSGEHPREQWFGYMRDMLKTLASRDLGPQGSLF